MLNTTQDRALQRLIAASISVTALADSGALGEAYDGAELQQATVVAALDELADASQSAMAAFADVIAA